MRSQFYAALASFIITIALGILLIPALDKLKFGQTIRSDGPRRHLKNRDTDYGRIIFIPAIALATILFSGISENALVVIFQWLVWPYRFADDFIKITQKRS